jgi:hypothetical protein
VNFTDGKYFSLDTNGVHVLAFNSKDTAHSCMKYAAFYKSKYNTWPPLSQELSKEVVQLKHTNSLRKSLQALCIKEHNLENFAKYCTMTNVGLLYCYNFEFDFDIEKIHVNFNAETLNVPIYDSSFSQVAYLDDLFKL